MEENPLFSTTRDRLEEAGEAIKRSQSEYLRALGVAKGGEARLLEVARDAIAPYLCFIDGPPPYPMIEALLGHSDRGRGIKVGERGPRGEFSLWLCAYDPPGGPLHRAVYVEVCSHGGPAETVQTLSPSEAIDHGWRVDLVLGSLLATLGKQEARLQRKGKDLSRLSIRIGATLLFVWNTSEV